jgi:hypothetical protein
MRAEQTKFNILYSGIIFVAMLITYIQLLTIQGNPEISEFYLTKYLWLGIFSVVVSFFSICFIWVKEPLTAHIPALASSDEYRIIPWTWLKFVLMIIFSVTILLSVTTLKIQVIPVPHVTTTGYLMSPITEMYYSSVIPALYEDFTFGLILPTLLFNILWLIFFLTLKIDLRANKFIYLGSMLVILFISSVGYGLIIPGFATAHIPVYQDNIEAYLSATVFMFAQSLIYAVTGLFFPLAHLIHNALFTLGFVVAYSIGGISTTGSIVTSLMPIIFFKLKQFKKKYEK